MKLTEINSNIIFLFPIITSLLKREFLYFSLSISICIASYLYHYYKNNHHKNIVNKLRYSDISIAILSYSYMFYFVSSFTTYKQFSFYILLFITICMYFIGKSSYGRQKNIHSYFHLAVGIVSGVIPLAA